MTNETTKEWVLPASIPFADLKGKDLEECLYWLFDAMGAKDLEWRSGGSGGGAPDGGRDLEAHFYTPGADNEIDPQIWWIECKGRKSTVESDEVKSAVINAQAKSHVDFVVIVTNAQFSNPTRDWVKEWQTKHPRPKIKLWDSAHLERLLSRHPDVVLRLFSQALSLQGRFQAMESRFWNKLEFVVPQTLADLWKGRDDIEITAMGTFAAISNEFATGEIARRPWAAALNGESLLEVLHIGLLNASYLVMRSSKAGVDTAPIVRSYAYLILCALQVLSAEQVAKFVEAAITRDKEMPDEVREFLLMPIVDQLLSEIQDVCSSDCSRIMSIDRGALTKDKDEVDGYWRRMEKGGSREDDEGPRGILRLERQDAPCKVGFPVNKDNGCPLFRIEPSVHNVAELFGIIKEVAAFRRNEAAFKSAAKAEASS